MTKGEQLIQWLECLKISDCRCCPLYKNRTRIVIARTDKNFDPEIVKVFLSNLAIHPVGSIVQLNNNAVGRVISANPELPLKPKVSIIIDEFGDKLEKEKVIDLHEVSSLFIKKPLSKTTFKQLLNE